MPVKMRSYCWRPSAASVGPRARSISSPRERIGRLDLPGDDLPPDPLDLAHEGTRHLRADLPQAHTSVAEVPDLVAARLQPAPHQGLDGLVGVKVVVFQHSREDVAPEEGLINVDAAAPH